MRLRIVLGVLLLLARVAPAQSTQNSEHPDHPGHGFNLDLALVADFRGNVSTRDENPARDRFDLSSIELDLRADFGERADVVVILPFVREMEDELFFDPDDASDDIDSRVEIEEAYIRLHDLVPNLTLKAGRFHLRFGKQNLLHLHDLPTVDQAFVYQSFLSHEAIIDNGVSFTYAFNEQVEATMELTSGEGSEHQPVANNSGWNGTPALNTHLAWKRNLASDWNLELGGSWLTTTRNDDNDQRANLLGTDITLSRPGQVVQLEAIYGDVDVTRDDDEQSLGAFLLFQQQLARDWHAGVRLDWTEDALDASQEVWGVSPYVSWQWRELVRLRLEYQHRNGDVEAEDTLYFQMTWFLNDHSGHVH